MVVACSRETIAPTAWMHACHVVRWRQKVICCSHFENDRERFFDSCDWVLLAGSRELSLKPDNLRNRIAISYKSNPYTLLTLKILTFFNTNVPRESSMWLECHWQYTWYLLAWEAARMECKESWQPATWQYVRPLLLLHAVSKILHETSP